MNEINNIFITMRDIYLSHKDFFNLLFVLPFFYSSCSIIFRLIRGRRSFRLSESSVESNLLDIDGIISYDEKE